MTIREPARDIPVMGEFDIAVIGGRCIDADKDAFGALRVMISLNQTGEAAGVACFEALTNGIRVQDVDIKSLRKRMA